MLDSPDGTGKTEIGRHLSKRLEIPYFKMTTEHENWRHRTFIDALRFDQTYISEFLKQTKHSAIIDRAYPAEWVYSRVFKRMTDDEVLKRVDSQFALMNAVIIIPMRKDYRNSREDEIIPKEKLQDIHDTYNLFCDWTQCRTMRIYVDTYENDLKREEWAFFTALDLFDKGHKNVIMEAK